MHMHVVHYARSPCHILQITLAFIIVIWLLDQEMCMCLLCLHESVYDLNTRTRPSKGVAPNILHLLL